MEAFKSFNTTVIPDDDKNIQNICPSFEARTPYLIVLISSTLSIWFSFIIFVFTASNSDLLNDHDDYNHKYEPTAIELATAAPGRTQIQAEKTCYVYNTINSPPFTQTSIVFFRHYRVENLFKMLLLSLHISSDQRIMFDSIDDIYCSWLLV